MLKTDPDWRAVRADVPPSVRRLVRSCLEKDPRRRLQAIGDARIALQEAAGDGLTATPERASAAPAWRLWATSSALLAAGAIAGWLAARAQAPRDAATPQTLPLHLTVDVPLALEEAPAFALSRDATMLAFVGGSSSSRKLYIRRLDAPIPTVLSGSDGASSPFFSPNGQWVAFVANQSLWKARVSGSSAPVKLAVATDRGGVWTDEDTIIYAQSRVSGLFQIAADGGTPTPLTRPGATAINHRFPTWIPDSRAVLFSARSDAQSAIFAFDLDTNTQTMVVADAYHPVYADPRRLLFMRGAALYSAPLDPERLTITGPETRVTDGLRAFPDVMAAQFAAAGRTLLFQPGAVVQDQAVVVWRTSDGREQPLMPEPDTYRDPRFSPDGGRLAYAVLPRGLGSDLWIYDRSRGVKTRLTYETNPEWNPAWTPDGQSIAYSDTANGIRLIRADGSGESQILTGNGQQWQLPASFSPGARHLAYTELHRETNADIWVLPLDPKGPPFPFVKTPFIEQCPMFSPNGRWIAYGSNESGTFELYVRPFPGPGPKYQISGDQSFDVHEWSADGTRLFYRSGDGRRMMSVPVRSDRADFEFGKPSILFELDPEQYPDMQFWSSFSAAPDGNGFALVKRTERDASARTYLTLMLDWR